jgi:serine/threonine-protein kinase RsbW
MTADEHVTLTVPATPDYLRLARLASADAASRAGFDYEEIDDLRIAVTELCHLLIGADAKGEVTLAFHVTPDGVTIEGHAAQPGNPVDNEFSETLIATVVDEHSLTDGDGGRRFQLRKRRRSDE